jgi:CubicO group peptidase (beta-lactamase class C family)
MIAFTFVRMLISRWIIGLASGVVLFHGAAPRQSTPLTAAAVAGTVDPIVEEGLARERIPGAAFVVVRDGTILYSRGYGLAEAAGKRSVRADATIWRVGSISKVFTAAGVMQLVDRKLVDLDAPIQRYIKRLSIPAGSGEPVTVRHLLSHTAGFDEIRPGTQVDTRAEVLPLAEFLRGRLVPVRPPGRTIAYSTYGITLAGELIEEVTGTPFETYLQRHVWGPLGMDRSSITVPDALQADVALGYEVKGDALVPQPWEWYHTTPASSVNATAADMAKFMIALLEDGRLGGARLFGAEAAREMQRRQVTMHPSMPGFALGLYEDYVGLQRVLEHGGNMAGFSALMVLIPEARVGFFIVNQRESSSLRDIVKSEILKKFFPSALERRTVPPLPSPASVRAEQFVGRYAPLWSCFSCQPIRVPSVLPVTANADGTISFAGGRWIAVDELRFVRENGSGYIVFRRDASGAIRELFAGGHWGWQKVADK